MLVAVRTGFIMMVIFPRRGQRGDNWEEGNLGMYVTAQEIKYMDIHWKKPL